MQKTHSLTEGSIFSSLLHFALPVMLTLFLQALYGGVDLLIVGQFAETANVSGVASGSMLLSTVTTVVTGLSMGITVSVGERIGQKDPEAAGHAIGSGIFLFTGAALCMTLLLVLGADGFAHLLHVPAEAFSKMTAYSRICGAGMIFIVSYNVLGAVFRGIGDSKTPLVTVSIACIVNILGDLLLVAGLQLGAAGAALATVLAQGFSVFLSFLLIRKKTLPFHFHRDMLRPSGSIIAKEIRLGAPVALQDLLVGTSFLVLQTIINAFGVTASAGIGVAEKVCVFIMLVPSAFAQSMSAFVAQNMGAGNPQRAKQALRYGILMAFSAGLVMSVLTFLRGDVLASLFSKDAAVVTAAHSYLKAYAIDCLLTPFMFCFIGYFNGCERTLFVMLQGLVGAFLVRIPVAFCVSRLADASIFEIGLATPASSFMQILLCIWMFRHLRRKNSGVKLPVCGSERA